MRDVADLMSLSGRTALLTGGAGHIGCVAADALAELGADIVLLDLDQVALDAVATDIASQRGVRCLTLACDLASASATQAMATRLSFDIERLDIVINAAALVGTSALSGWTVPFEEQSEEAWKKCFDVNLTAPFLVIQSLLPLLKASSSASIINVASIYGVVAPDWGLYDGTAIGNPAAYGASKAGLLQLTRYLATTLAPGIRVNSITPGGVERGQAETFMKNYNSRTPLARMATEEDMKGAFVFLASDLSRYVTGQNLIVDGGWTVK